MVVSSLGGKAIKEDCHPDAYRRTAKSCHRLNKRAARTESEEPMHLRDARLLVGVVGKDCEYIKVKVQYLYYLELPKAVVDHGMRLLTANQHSSIVYLPKKCIRFIPKKHHT